MIQDEFQQANSVCCYGIKERRWELIPMIRYNQSCFIGAKTDRSSNFHIFSINLRLSFSCNLIISVSNQVYDSHSFHETVILGNDAIFKCSIPSFVSDFVTVQSWVDSEGQNYGASTSFGT